MQKDLMMLVARSRYGTSTLLAVALAVTACGDDSGGSETTDDLDAGGETEQTDPGATDATDVGETDPSGSTDATDVTDGTELTDAEPDAGTPDAGVDGYQSELPEGWADEVAVPLLEDLDDDPDVIEVELEAVVSEFEYEEGTPTEVWTYNGSLPGPTLAGKVGDTVVVHFTNNLPEETTVHWHGIDVPAAMDGSNIAQIPVEPGESFTYEFTLMRPGTFWYHPHVRTNAQVELGLQGMIVVEDPETDAELELPEDELWLVLDDVLLDGDEVAEPFPSDPAEYASTQVNGRIGNKLLVNGREKPTVKVLAGVPLRLRMVNTANSRIQNIGIDGHSLWQIGGDVDLFASARMVEAPGMDAIMPEMMHGDAGAMHGDMMMDGGMMDGGMMMDAGMVPDMMMDGGMMDGGEMEDHGGHMGGIAAPIFDGVVLTPGDRADVLFVPHGEVGDEFDMLLLDYPRGRHTVMIQDGMVMLAHDEMDGMAPAESLVTFEIVGEGADPVDSIELPETLNEIDAIDVDGAGTLPVMLGHSQPDETGAVNFFARMIDGAPVPFGMMTAEDGLQVTVGETYVWEVTNMTMGAHNFHSHGWSFQLLETEYIDENNEDNNMVMKPKIASVEDTILVPARPGAAGTSRTVVRLAVTFDDVGREGQVEAWGLDPTEGHSGGWLAHCHLLEHSARGMMTFFEVRE